MLRDIHSRSCNVLSGPFIARLMDAGEFFVFQSWQVSFKDVETVRDYVVLAPGVTGPLFPGDVVLIECLENGCVHVLDVERVPRAVPASVKYVPYTRPRRDDQGGDEDGGKTRLLAVLGGPEVLLHLRGKPGE